MSVAKTEATSMLGQRTPKCAKEAVQSFFQAEEKSTFLKVYAFEFFRICLKKAHIITYLTDNGVAVERHDFDHGLHDRDDKVFWVAQPKLGKVSRHTNQKPEHVELYQVQLLLAT